MDFKGLRIHVIGIGGIGVSGLARFLKSQGAIVSGSDITKTSITIDLEKEGIQINIPHSKDIIKDKDLIIHSAIIKDTNVEIIESKKLKKQILSRKEALKLLLENKKVLSVCAAHGKSSTSALLASILQNGGAIIGAISKEFNSNVRVSDNEILVFEADESDKSFLNSNPYKSIVVNIEAEHLETYNNSFENLKEAYIDFISLSKKTILNLECPTIRELKKTNKIKVDSIYLNPESDIKNISYKLIDNKPYTSFDFLDFGNFSVYGIGRHHALNASIAILSSLDLLPLESIRKNLLNFKGIKKRFDILQSLDSNNPCIIDDYAHHPTEILATLKATKIFADLLSKDNGKQKITAIFQPHKYSRFRDNLKDFCNCFSDCDELVILPVYAAGEEKIDFDFKELFKKYRPTFADRIKKLDNKIALLDNNKNVIKELDYGIIIGLGAGDITYQLRGEK